MIIYKTINLINNKIYIGQDRNNNPNYLGSGKKILRAIKKYGKQNFKKEILEECSATNLLNEREPYWIAFYNSTNKEIGYNILPGGYCNWNTLTYEEILELKQKISNSLKGKKHSEETKEKMSKTHIGKSKSKEHCKNISNSKKGHKYNLGKKCSEETKIKISKANKGKKRTEEQLIVMKTKSLSEETKQKISNTLKGRSISEETKKKISETMKILRASQKEKQNEKNLPSTSK